MPVKASVLIQEPLLTDAYDRYPVTRGMSVGRVLRFALAIAVGKSETEAVAATQDTRIGTTRKPHMSA